MTRVDGPQPGATEVTVWDLELAGPDALRPGREPDVEPVLLVAERSAPELSRFFYQLVGGPWHWVDRLDWPPERWASWSERPELHLVTCWVDGVPAGYYELEVQGASVEIVYFGLAERFFGCGLGGWLLTDALRRATDLDGAERVWLHTCSLDGPAALGNYQARGMTIVRQSSEWRLVTP
ncbi:MAG: GNAT family N-acetyltransferase [Actinomycetota bacterium]